MVEGVASFEILADFGDGDGLEGEAFGFCGFEGAHGFEGVDEGVHAGAVGEGVSGGGEGGEGGDGGGGDDGAGGDDLVDVPELEGGVGF